MYNIAICGSQEPVDPVYPIIDQLSGHCQVLFTPLLYIICIATPFLKAVVLSLSNMIDVI